MVLTRGRQGRGSDTAGDSVTHAATQVATPEATYSSTMGASIMSGPQAKATTPGHVLQLIPGPRRVLKSGGLDGYFNPTGGLGKIQSSSEVPDKC